MILSGGWAWRLASLAFIVHLPIREVPPREFCGAGGLTHGLARPSPGAYPLCVILVGWIAVMAVLIAPGKRFRRKQRAPCSSCSNQARRAARSWRRS